MIVSFTGTRRGMTARQKAALDLVLANPRVKALHHGGCTGADEEAHALARERHPGVHTAVHPGNGPKWRGVTANPGYVYQAEDPLVRNRHIVEAGTLLVAAPDSLRERTRSGTWATVRYARKLGRPVLVLDP